MIIIEAFMLAAVAALLAYSIYTDLTQGIVENRAILFAFAVVLVSDIVYYLLWGRQYLISLAVNVAFVIVISLILYATGVWGGGDCKLLIVVVSGIPAGIYCNAEFNVQLPCFLLLGDIFSVSFVYLIVETIYLGIKEKNLFHFRKQKLDLKVILVYFVSTTLTMSITSSLLVYFISPYYVLDSASLCAFNFVIILIMMPFQNKINWIYAASSIALWIILMFLNICQLNTPGITLQAPTIAVIVLLFRVVSGKYNYKTIPTEDTRKGMILSFSTVLKFSGSRIKGLPSATTEDLRSRITESEADSIRRWKNSASGADTITIVRKIPFAVFISLGTIIFVTLEMMSL